MHMVDHVVMDVSDFVASASPCLANLYQKKQKSSLTLFVLNKFCVYQPCLSFFSSFPFSPKCISLSYPYKSFLSCFIILNNTYHNCLVVLLIKHPIIAILFYYSCFEHRSIKTLVNRHHRFIIHHLYTRCSIPTMYHQLPISVGLATMICHKHIFYSMVY